MNKLLAFTFLALLGCRTEDNQTVKVINFDEVEEIQADLKIEKVILLETDTTELLSDNVIVRYSKDGFFVMNVTNAKGIHHFSPTGKHLGMAAKIGEAPGQVLNIQDFRLQANSLLVMTAKSDRIVLQKISMEHELETTTEIPHYAFSFEPVDNGDLWLYGGYYILSGDYRLIQIDRFGKLKSELLPNSIPPIGQVGGNAFYQGYDRILFREPLKNSVWEITAQDTLKEAYRFDFGENTVPVEFWENDLFKGFGEIMAKGFIDIFFLVESDRYFLADVSTQKGMNRTKDLFIRDNQSDNQYKIRVNREELGHFYLPIGIDGEYFMFIAYAPYLIGNKEVLNVSEKVKVQLADLKEESNPVILYAKVPN